MPESSYLTLEDCIVWCDEAMSKKNWGEAIERWRLMREKFPESSRGYVGGTKALKESKNFEAADALVLKGIEKFPKEPGLYAEYGDIAVCQKNWPEAVKRWAFMRENIPAHSRGYAGGAKALRWSGKFEAADALVLKGIEKFPKESGLYAEYGDIAVCQKNWPEAVKRWAFMREKCPEHARGYFSGATALKENQEFEAADALAFEGMGKFPQESRLYIEYGDIAMRRKNWAEAIERWALMREKCPDHPRGYTGGAKALKENQNFEAADVLVLEGIEKFPKEPGLYAEYGDIAMRRKDWPEAVKRWAFMREKCPEHARGYFSGMMALKENQAFAAADALALEGMEKFPKEPKLYIEYGEIAMRRKDWPEAARRWALMREKIPAYPRGYVSGDRALREQKDFEAADALVLEGLKKFPDELELKKRYGDIVMRQKDWDAAIKLCSPKSKNSPEDSQADLCREYADIAVRQKNWEEADVRWLLMRKKFPEHPCGYIGGIKALSECENFEAADALALVGMEKFPKEPDLYAEYVYNAVRQKNWSEAIKRWTLMREKCPEHVSWYFCGVMALKGKRYFNAADALVLRGMKRFPKEPRLYIEYSNVAICQKDWKEAAKRWALMREKCPDHPRGYMGGVAALKEMREFDAAEVLVLNGLKRFPEDVELYIEYGDIAMCQKHWESAIKRWALMREKCPDHPRGYVGGGAALKENQEFESAEALVLDGLKKFPEDVALYIEYGDIAMCQKNWDEAIKRWALMREKFPQHQHGYISGSIALREKGDLEAAEILILEGIRKFQDKDRLKIIQQSIRELQIARRTLENKDFDSIVKNIIHCTNIDEYLNLLVSISKSSGISIIITTKSDDGNVSKNHICESRKKTVCDAIHEIGFQAECGEIFCNNYIAILENKCIVCERYSADMDCATLYNSARYNIVLFKYESNEYCSIKIMNKEYAVNDAGINIVVYDIYTSALIDSISVNIYEEEITIGRKDRACDIAKYAKIGRNFGVDAYFFFAPSVYQIENPSEWESLLKNGYADTFTKDNVYKNYYELSGLDGCFSSIDEFCEHLKHPIENIQYKNYIKSAYIESKYLNIDIDGCRVLNNAPASYERVVHIFGDSVGVGWRMKDSDNFSYYLQQLLNDNNYNVRVMNHCVGGSDIDDVSNYIKDTYFNTGDIIIIFMSRGKERRLMYHLDAECLQYKSFEKFFDRPHNYGEVFLDRTHPNHNMYRVIADEMFRSISSSLRKNTYGKYSNDTVNIQYNQLHNWLDKLKRERRRIGTIVMNCNPFTNGHRHLIEYAAKESDWLYIFVVEEDKSIFRFKDRFELVKQGTKDINNVTVLPSGSFIISQLTFPEYSQKSSMQDTKIDPSLDVNLFAKYIAPVLGINMRFAGEEPLDKITYQYNECMKQILPKYGIEFREIPRKELGGTVISASRVRKLLKENNFEDIRAIVPETTFNYLKSLKKNV